MVNRHSLQWRNDITGTGGSEGDQPSQQELMTYCNPLTDTGQ